jgi:hypothetical protein
VILKHFSLVFSYNFLFSLYSKLIQVSLLTSFASNGNPNDNIIDADLQNVDIKPVDSTSPPFSGFIIDEKLQFRQMPEYQRLSIWDELYIKTNTPLF